MKLLLEVPEKRAAFLMELLNNLEFVRTRSLSKVKAARIEDMLEAIAEVKEVKQGKRKARPLKDLVREL